MKNKVNKEQKLEIIQQKTKEYKEKWKAYQTEVDKQIAERRERENKQFSWGQPVNLLPVFSHIYDYSTSKNNESIDNKEKEIREILLKSVEEKWQELQSYIQEELEAKIEILPPSYKN